MIEVKAIPQSEIAKAAKECLSARLYVPTGGFLMNIHLNILKKKDSRAERYKLFVAYSDGKPVGVTMTIDGYDDHSAVYIMSFVKKAYRKQGIGKQLAMVAKKSTKQKLWAYEGANGTRNYWESVDIKCR